MRSRAAASPKRARFFRRHHSELDRLGANFLYIHTAPVVADFDYNLIALMMSIQAYRPVRRFAGHAALFGRFDAVADGIAHHVGERLGDSIENSFIEVGVLSAEIQIHFASALPGHIAHHAREAAEKLLHWNHADFHDRTLEIV